jgi:hypothetical protein
MFFQKDGRDPSVAINKWNIGSFETTSTKRARTMHHFNSQNKSKQLKDHKGLFSALQGLSYNPQVGFLVLFGDYINKITLCVQIVYVILCDLLVSSPFFMCVV